MASILRIALLLLFVAASAPGQPAPIQGIVNHYTPVRSFGSCGSLVVADASHFSPGDLVLIIQMQGAAIVPENIPTYGTITDIGDAGNHELNRIAFISGDTIHLAFALHFTYTIAGRVQLVRVPEYADVDVAGTVTCAPWNGETGGVLAFVASGTVTLHASIDASGTGFRGGDVVQGTYVPYYEGAYVGPLNADRYGRKGEGTAGYGLPPDMYGGRGAPANGGGGGGNHNAGGGGGSNAGCGGFGGEPFQSGAYSGDPTDAQGQGGHPLNIPGRVFMGGGGGAGHDNNHVGTGGGNGGGIVLIEAAALAGTGWSIGAAGDDSKTAQYDGAGGAGGGGSVLLNIGSYNCTLTADVRGGTGGGAGSTSQNAGPGGGGGGGVIAFAGAAPATTALTIASAGGEPGANLQDGTAYGATRGCDGVVQENVRTVRDSVPIAGSNVDAGPDTVICEGGRAQLHAQGGPVLHWSPAAGLSCTECPNPIASPSATTTYHVTSGDAGSCSTNDSVTVTVRSVRRLHAEVGRYHAAPGRTLTVPIVYSGDAAGIGALEMTLHYDPKAVHLDGTGPMPGGWLVSEILNDRAAGVYSLRAVPLGTTPLAGTLANIVFTLYLGSSDSIDLPFVLSAADPAACLDVTAVPGRIVLDSICGLHLRLIAPLLGSYALDGNRPNPFNPTTEILFSLGLDGPTTLIVYDAAGHAVATLVHGHLAAGRYGVQWNAGGYPSGVYRYRIVSGTWSEEGSMVLMK
ncbi:MAG TPA: hypothetical protein VHI13_21690 [Candidatus Kapabacteria bacterium]|nr:hypothetical protein [Candidatus Kapabacteria bacterium]